jgi:uncharacterized protein (DUF1778 family)
VKNEQLQIRLTRSQKDALRRRALLAGQDVSTYVLSRVAPAAGERFAAVLAALRNPSGRRFALAELHDLLVELAPAEFGDALSIARLDGLPDVDRNRVAAMVEHAAALKGASPPAWVRDVEPLERPVFASDLPSLRAHLLRASPAAFRRRNLFVDSTVGDRV